MVKILKISIFGLLLFLILTTSCNVYELDDLNSRCKLITHNIQSNNDIEYFNRGSYEYDEQGRLVHYSNLDTRGEFEEHFTKMDFTYSADGNKIEIIRSDSIVDEIKYVNEVKFQVQFYDDKIITTYDDSVKWLEFDLNSKNQVKIIQRYIGNSAYTSVKLIWKNGNIETIDAGYVPNAVSKKPMQKMEKNGLKSESFKGNTTFIQKEMLALSNQNEVKYEYSSFLNPMYNLPIFYINGDLTYLSRNQLKSIVYKGVEILNFSERFEIKEQEGRFPLKINLPNSKQTITYSYNCEE